MTRFAEVCSTCLSNPVKPQANNPLTLHLLVALHPFIYHQYSGGPYTVLPLFLPGWWICWNFRRGWSDYAHSQRCHVLCFATQQ